jgi:hypothetical protein
MNPSIHLQEALALVLVAAVVAFALWRRSRRARPGPGCNNCDKPAATPKEIPLRFYRRKP